MLKLFAIVYKGLTVGVIDNLFKTVFNEPVDHNAQNTSTG